MDLLFNLFDKVLRDRGYLAMGGQIVDASIIQAPRQRMTKEEKAQVKAGEIPQAWKDNPAKLAQKERIGLFIQAIDLERAKIKIGSDQSLLQYEEAYLLGKTGSQHRINRSLIHKNTGK